MKRTTSLALFLLIGCGSPVLSETQSTVVPAPSNYLHDLLTELDIINLFQPANPGLIEETDIVRLLVEDAQILEMDAERTTFGDPTSNNVMPTPDRLQAYQNDLFQHLDYFFGPGTAPNSARAILQRLVARRQITPRMLLAQLRIGMGLGPCAGAPAGSPDCPATVNDLQTGIALSLNGVHNIRTFAVEDDQYTNVFAVNRESIAYRKLFDLFARHFGGYPYNPLKDVVLDVSNPQGPDCQLLESMLANGHAAGLYIAGNTGISPAMSVVTQRLYDGEIELSGDGRRFEYGLYHFWKGQNCSRINNDPFGQPICYAGEPEILQRFAALRPGAAIPVPDSYDYLQRVQAYEAGGLRAITPPAPQWSFSCADVAALVNLIGSIPFADAYDAIVNAEDYPFDDQSPEVTAEELLAFLMGIGNAHVNRPDAPFIDNISELSEYILIDRLVYHAEFEFHSRLIPHVFDLYVP